MQLTASAIDKVNGLLQGEPPDTRLRVAVRPGGCSGFSYEMFFDTDAADDDVITAQSDTVALIVDAASAPLVAEATLDYVDGLAGAGFKMDNPGAKRTCGCGKSFS